MNAQKKGVVIRGRFAKPRHEPSTIARRNKIALAVTTSVHVQSDLGKKFGTVEGQIVRATELLASLTRAQRTGINEQLHAGVQGGKKIKDLAWEFVEAKDQTLITKRLEYALRARAFLILAYGAKGFER